LPCREVGTQNLIPCEAGFAKHGARQPRSSQRFARMITTQNLKRLGQGRPVELGHF
jgi:hypothetical protein